MASSVLVLKKPIYSGMKNHNPGIDKSLTILGRHFYQFQLKLYSMSNAVNRTILIAFAYLFSEL